MAEAIKTRDITVPGGAGEVKARVYTPDGATPEGATETALAAIWADLLGVSRITRDDHFFRLGGHSLTATRMVARIETELGRRVPLKAVFEAPTLRGFVVAVEAAGASGADDEKLARADALLAELDA